jgi:hypothetical protein
MSSVVYLYGFVPADAPAPAQLSGIAGTPVRVLDVGALRAVVSDLPADVYGAQQVEARLQDLGWVGEQGVAHERVVTWYVDNAEILPARLFSLYSSEAALRAAVTPTLPHVARALEVFAGRREWNLKAAYDAERIAQHGAELSDELRTIDEEIAAAPPGRRYLLQRRRADVVKREVSRMAHRAADELLAALARHAVQHRVLPLGAADASGTVVLNAALLVERAAEAALRTDAERLHEHYTGLGLIVSFSGPWAPYRFMEQHGEA